MRYVLAPALASLALGCAPRPAPMSAANASWGGAIAADATPGKTALVVADHLPWPYRLRDVRVAIDGVALFAGAPHAGGATGEVPIARGDHTLAIVASVDVARGGEACQVRLRLARPLHVTDTAPATVVVDLFARDVTKSFGARLAAHIDLVGATAPAAAEPDPHDDLSACAALAAPDAALCRIEAESTRARSMRDLSRLACMSDKLSEMRTLAEARTRSVQRLADLAARAAKGAMEGATDGAAEARAAEEARLASLEHQLLGRGEEAARCMSAETAPSSSTPSIDDGCAADDDGP